MTSRRGVTSHDVKKAVATMTVLGDEVVLRPETGLALDTTAMMTTEVHRPVVRRHGDARAPRPPEWTERRLATRVVTTGVPGDVAGTVAKAEVGVTRTAAHVTTAGRATIVHRCAVRGRLVAAAVEAGAIGSANLAADGRIDSPPATTEVHHVMSAMAAVGGVTGHHVTGVEVLLLLEMVAEVGAKAHLKTAVTTLGAVRVSNNNSSY